MHDRYTSCGIGTPELREGPLAAYRTGPRHDPASESPEGYDAVDELPPAHYDGRMSTEPPSRDELHRHRGVAESFGTDAERYDRTRPHYPGAMVERIVAASPGPDFLDVGIGT